MKYLFFVVLVLLSFFFLCGNSNAIAVKSGEAAPDFHLDSISGKSESLSNFSGSIVILTYWNPDQERSIETLTDLKEILSEFGSKGVQIIGITAAKDDQEMIRDIINNKGIYFEILLDPERQLYGDYGIRVYPSTIIIDREGKVAFTIAGHALSYKVKVKSAIRYMLGEITQDEFKSLLTLKIERKDEKSVLAHRRYNLAMKFVNARLFDQAIFVIEKSISSNPGIAESHILLGFLRLENDEPELAYKEFSKALKLDPDAHDAKTGLGAALIEKGKIDKAIIILKDALKSNPNPQRTYFELGRAYALSGEKDKSIEMYKKVLEGIIQKRILPSSISKCD